MSKSFSVSDFDQLSWHDCHIWGVAFRVGDPERGEWFSELAIDLDFILEWICQLGGGAQFRVAPASLVFHDVTDPRINVSWSEPGSRCAIHPVSIAHIEREPVPGADSNNDRPNYVWTINLNWPAGGVISLTAPGFTMEVSDQTVLSDQQLISHTERRRLLLT